MKLPLAVLLAGLCIQAQTFEVASVKRVPGTALRAGLVRRVEPTSLTLRNASLGNCIDFAYGFGHERVVGPDWRDRPTNVLFDIEARAAAPVPKGEMQLMLQALLAARLGLAVHREQRDIPIYALTLAKDGPKSAHSKAVGEFTVKPTGPVTTKFENVSMARFAATFGEPFTSRLVIDQTGLEGNFDFTLDLSRFFNDNPTHDPRGGLDMEAAYLQTLPQQLGLKLEPKKARLEVLVIDRVEKEPTAN